MGDYNLYLGEGGGGSYTEFLDDFPIPLEGDISGIRGRKTVRQATLERIEEKLDRLTDLLESSINANRVPVFYREGTRWEAY